MSNKQGRVKMMLNTVSLFIAILLAALGPGALAFDLLPEYQGLSEAELEINLRPTAIDSETQLVMDSALPPLAWERLWTEGGNVFDLSTGSLDNKRLLFYSRLKASTELNETLRFHFTYFSQRDLEVDQVRHVLELSQSVGGGISVNLYGEPSLYKRENDIGTALVYAPASGGAHRLYYTLHDFTRAEHNDQADRFAKSKDPRSVGWSSYMQKGEWWLRAGVRYDQPVTWIRPQEKREFLYEKSLAYADIMWRQWSLRAQWDRTAKGDSDEHWRQERLVARLTRRFGVDDDFWRYELFLQHAQREWKRLDGAGLSHFNEMPGFAVERRGTRRPQGFDLIRAEFEAVAFSRQGELDLGGDQKRKPFEDRLQLTYEFALNEKARLGFALNFDLDEWTPVPTFEGGNGRFRAEF